MTLFRDDPAREGRTGDPLTIVVIMDPLEAVSADTDTSVALMAAAGERGHHVWCCTAADVHWDRGAVGAVARPVRVAGRQHVRVTAGDAESLHLAAADVVLVRTDPPVDDRYLHLTQLLDLLGDDTLVVNRPAGLRDANEKLWACHFPDLMPPTVVSADRARLWSFAQEHGRAVVKSLDSHAGRAVHLLDPADPNARAILDTATARGTRVVLAQEFLADVYRGDKRILLLDGAPLGAINRTPAAGDFRANIGAGARVEPAGIDESDARIIDRLAPALTTAGLWLVGIDVIGGRLSEINVTSPTGLRQMMDGAGGRPDHRVIGWLERRAPGHRCA